MSGRNNTTNSGRPPKSTIASKRDTRSPLTPRLAANGTTTSSSPSLAKRPILKTTVSTRSPLPPPPEDVETPVKAFLSSNITPRSSSRKSRGGSPFSTASAAGEDTPSHSRAKSPLATTSVSGFDRPNKGTSTSNGNGLAPRVKSVINGRERTASPPVVRIPGYQDNENSGIDQVVQDSSSNFFHADDARSQLSQEKPQSSTSARKGPAFFYANGNGTLEASRELKPVSPALSAVSETRSLGSHAYTVPLSEGVPSPPLLSPALSTLSSRSPFVTSPPVSATLNVAPLLARTPESQSTNNPASLLSKSNVEQNEGNASAPITTASEFSRPTAQRKVSFGSPSLRSGHAKSISMSVIAAESPNASRRRSATWTELVQSASPTRSTASSQSPTRQMRSPILSQIDTTTKEGGSLFSDPVQSPTKAVPDLAAEARRERKVLDLEISNSSLLAINRSLEREVKKQKTELKRFRRLSRAGRFSTAPDQGIGRLSALEEEDLPSIDGDDDSYGRPSSPFDEDASDMSSNDGSSLAASLSPSAQAERDAQQRVKDEQRLQHDLRKHRDLLLDTQKMNQSLQRCLTWTEDLIKGGRKALQYHVRSTDFRLGGRILSGEEPADMGADDMDDDDLEHSPPPEEQDDEGVEDGDTLHTLQDNELGGMEAFLGMSPFKGARPGSLSVDSERTDRDSGIEVDRPPMVKSQLPVRKGMQGLLDML